MCSLSYFPPGVMPVRAHLENGARLNPHGCGFALGYTAMRSMDSQEMIRQFLIHRWRFPLLPALFHSRNASGDSPRTEENLHPFTVQRDGHEQAFVAHNGYLFKHEGSKSDSLIFAEQILPKHNLDDPGVRALLEQRMGRNKAVILYPDSTSYILNAHLGVSLPDGTWHSNTDFTGVPHIIPGLCPLCGDETELTPVCASCEKEAQARRELLFDV